MIRNIRLLCITFLSLCAPLTAQPSFADYIGAPASFSFTGNVARVTDSGVNVPTNYINTIPQSIKNQTETYFESLTVTPDLQKLYSFTNTLGLANYVLAWDTATSNFRPTDTFSPSGVGNDYVDNARMPVIIGNEIFVSSFVTGGNTSRQVKRFDLTSHSLLQTIDPLTPQLIDDIALTPSGSSLYVAGASGIYIYGKVAGVYQSTVKSLLLPGVNGNIAVGPDNRLYVRNFSTGDVQRFLLNGSFDGIFLSHNDYPNLGTIQFGIDGNLHAYQFLGSGNQIRKFDPATGSLLSSTPAGLIGNGRIAFLPVPEPTGFALVAIGLAILASRRRAIRC